MKLFSIIALFTLTQLATSVPSDNHIRNDCRQSLTQEQAEKYIADFWSLLSQTANKPKDVANKLFTTKPLFYSGSELSLRNQDVTPFGTPLDKTLSDVANGVDDLKGSDQTTYFISMGRGIHQNDLFWHWQFNHVGKGKENVRGFNCFSLRCENGQWKAWRMSYEFDSKAWAADK